MFKWKDSYNCNISEIDRQHRKLFEIGSRIFDVASLKDGYDHFDEIMEIFTELKDYTVYHFGYEEKLMEEYGYDSFDTHRIEHTFFIRKLNKMAGKSDEIDENQDRAMMEIVKFVADWITGHILETDMKYIGFFKSKGIS